MGQRSGMTWFVDLLVVVVGIFLALLANNWNLDRVARQQELAMLRAMQEDLSAEDAEIQRVKGFYAQNFEALGSYGEIAGDAALGAKERSAKLAGIYRRLGSWEFLASKAYTYHAARSSGALGRITDAGVRKALAQAQAALDGIGVQGDALARIQIGLLTRELIQQIDFASGRFFDDATALDPRTANKVRLVLGAQRNFVEYLETYEAACGDVARALARVLGS